MNNIESIKQQFDFNNEKKMLVTFGPPGVGKTTLLNGLKGMHEELKIVSETRKILDDETLLGDNLTKATKGDYESYFLFQMAILPERFNKCFYSPNNCLVDDSIFGTYAYSEALHELGWIDNEEHYVFLENFYRYLDFHPIPKKIIYLSCHFESLKDRIAKRGREIEKLYKDEYLEALNTSFEKTAKRFQKEGYDFLFVDTESKDIDTVREFVKPHVQNIWS